MSFSKKNVDKQNINMFSQQWSMKFVGAIAVPNCHFVNEAWHLHQPFGIISIAICNFNVWQMESKSTDTVFKKRACKRREPTSSLSSDRFHIRFMVFFGKRCHNETILHYSDVNCYCTHWKLHYIFAYSWFLSTHWTSQLSVAVGVVGPFDGLNIYFWKSCFIGTAANKFNRMIWIG